MDRNFCKEVCAVDWLPFACMSHHKKAFFQKLHRSLHSICMQVTPHHKVHLERFLKKALFCSLMQSRDCVWFCFRLPSRQCTVRGA